MHALLLMLVDTSPDENDVVAGWTAFGLFGLLIVAVAVLGFSLTKRLRNVERAAEQGLYDPSTPKNRPARGLAAARQQREQAAADDRGAAAPHRHRRRGRGTDAAAVGARRRNHHHRLAGGARPRRHRPGSRDRMSPWQRGRSGPGWSTRDSG